MSGILLSAIGIVLFALGYFFYGGLLERLFEVDPSKPTPAHYKYDGIDYVPAKH
jgi:carbon starvation protein